jgi:hypothetical protein
MTTELRKSARYHMGAPVVFIWKDQNGGSRRSEGITRDMSGAGAFVWAESCPPVGAVLRCEIFLPATSPGAKRLLVTSTATTRRVDLPLSEHHREGFAVQFERLTISSAAGRLAQLTQQAAS